MRTGALLHGRGGAATIDGARRVANPGGLLTTGRRKRSVTETVERRDAVVYARFSGLNQHESSIARQYADAAAYTARCGLTIVRRYSDRAKTATMRAGRHNLERMLRDARNGMFAVIVLEDIDRLARDVADLYAIVKDLTAFGVEVHENKSGRIDGVALAAKAHMAAQEREQQQRRLRDGRRRALWEGRTSSLTYGYMLVRGQSGIRRPHPQRAAVVRRIFEAVASGESIIEIAAGLTGREPTPGDCRKLDRGVMLPEGRHGTWSTQTVRNIIANQKYMGLLVDGMTKRINDPVTGSRTKRTDEEDWDVVHVPELAIVGTGLWEAAQAKARLHYFGAAPVVSRPLLRRKLIRCAGCGDAVETIGEPPTVRYRCSAPPCPGFGEPYAEWIDAAVLSMIGSRSSDASLREIRRKLEAQRQRAPRDRAEILTDLRRREDELHQALMASLEHSPPRPDHGSVVARAEGRIHELEAELDFVQGSAGLPARDADVVSQAVGRLMADVGKSYALDNTDAKLIRAIVSAVELEPASAELLVRLYIDPEALAFVAAGKRASAVPIVATETIKPRELEKRMRADRRTDTRRRRGESVTATLERSDRVADDLWRCLAPLFKRSSFDGGEFGWENRSLASAMLAYSRTIIDRDAAVGRLGPGHTFRQAAGRLIRSGLWQESVGLLAAEFPDALKGVRLHWTYHTDFWGGHAGRPPIGLHTAGDRAQLAARPASGPRHALRLEAVKLRLDGQRAAGVARTLGVPERYVTAWLELYRNEGTGALASEREEDDSLVAKVVGGVRERLDDKMCDDTWSLRLQAIRRHLDGQSRPEIATEFGLGLHVIANWIHRFQWGGHPALMPRQRQCLLSAAQIEELRAWTIGGVDPDDPSVMLTYEIVARCCSERFGVTYSTAGLNSLMVRLDMRLRDRERRPVSPSAKRAAQMAHIASEVRLD